MTIKQSRYITVDTTGKKEMAIRTTELDKVKDDPFVRKSEVQQTVSNSTLPVSSRAVNLFLSSYASITYVDDKFNSIDISKYATKTELAKKWDVQETVGSGKVMKEGAFGLGGYVYQVTEGNPWDQWGKKCMFIMNNANNDLPSRSYGIVLTPHNQDFYSALTWEHSDASKIRLFVTNYVGYKKTVDIYNSGNTTIDSNGFIKSASPIVRLFDDRIETNNQFKKEPEFKKIGTGVYQISGTLGLAKEGWYIETPRDRNGFPYFLVEWEQDENNVVTIMTFKRKIDLETLDFVNGEPVDIGEGQRWIDLRFHEEPEEIEELENGGA